MSKKKRAQWPPIYRATHRSGQASYQVDLGTVDGKRKRVNFLTKAEAVTFAEQARVAKANEGAAAFSLPMAIRLDALKANDILTPYDVSILDAAKYYKKHVLAYRTAPPVKDIVQRYTDDAVSRNLRHRTILDLRHRLETFAADFGESRLSDVTLEELKEWIQDDEWSMRTRINFLTKISQLYRFAILNGWADSNLTEKIARPTVDETTPEIFTIKEVQQLLAHALQFDLLPFIAIGLFAGVRTSEMSRLTGKSINFEEKIITIGADIAKKRSQRIVDMQPALLAWLEPRKEELQKGGPIIGQAKLAKNKESLMESAGLKEWRANGMRHSFGSYHFAMFRSAEDTSHQMGNSVDVVHKHYKALVPKAEAERFWSLRPSAESDAAASSSENVPKMTECAA